MEIPAEKKPLLSVQAARLLNLESYVSGNGSLTVLDGKPNIPFTISRIFYVWDAPKGAQRGHHAHRHCEQLLICLNGSCNVVCRDGNITAKFHLSQPDIGLYIPAGLWTEQTYETGQTILLVLTNRPYEDADYIRDYSVFMRYRNDLGKGG